MDSGKKNQEEYGPFCEPAWKREVRHPDADKTA